MNKIKYYIRLTLILLMAAIFYPCVYVFGFLMALVVSYNPHKTGVKCVDRFNGVFE